MKMYVAIALLLGGAAISLGAPLLPKIIPEEKYWNQEQAEEHSMAAATLHKASHEAVYVQDADENASADDKIQAQQALEAATARFERSRERLEKAQFWRTTLPRYLRVGGGVIALVGIVLYAIERGKDA